MRCCPCKHCLTTVATAVPNERHDSTTLTLTFISLLCFFFFFNFALLLYIFNSCFFHIPLFYIILLSTAALLTAADPLGRTSFFTWPESFLISRISTVLRLHSLPLTKRPYTILGEFLAFIL